MFDALKEDHEGGGGWKIIDPRPQVHEHPYTFFVPSDAEKAALASGDIVKLMFESLDPESGIVERMWVELEERDETGWCGTLTNQPFEIEGLSQGDTIHFKDFHIVSVWDLKIDQDVDEDRFFARCHVDPCVLDGVNKIGRLERRKPKRPWFFQRRERFTDTGWHIYSETNTKGKHRDMAYVAIGVLLNQDDRYLALLDSPVGTQIVRDGEVFRKL